MADQPITLSVAPGIDVAVKRSRQARRLSLRVSSLDGRVTLTLPRHVGTAEARAFAEERSDWIAQALAQVPSQIKVRIGIELPVEGWPFRLESGLRARLMPGYMVVPEDRAGAAARGLLRTLAHDRLVSAADRYAAEVGRPYAAISLRDTRSRWGSCTSERRLMFSWRLAMAPPEILDYVAAHEVAHLVHMDHSRAFWALVGDLCPKWRDHRDWLRSDGPDLHRYSFGD
ncbi:MAG: SprT family zinc-dependent metalloprotease [Pseudomonadota bacterium]